MSAEPPVRPEHPQLLRLEKAVLQMQISRQPSQEGDGEQMQELTAASKAMIVEWVDGCHSHKSQLSAAASALTNF